MSRNNLNIYKLFLCVYNYSMKSNLYLVKAIHDLGGQQKVAETVGICQQAVSAWLRNGIPLKHAVFLEKYTHGQLRAKELAPEYYSGFSKVFPVNKIRT